MNNRQLSRSRGGEGACETLPRASFARAPSQETHSKKSIEQLFSDAGFSVLKTYGVPVFVQPGHEDFDPSNEQKSDVSKYLENPSVFSTIFELEMQYNSLDTTANRGMNMFLLAEKK